MSSAQVTAMMKSAMVLGSLIFRLWRLESSSLMRAPPLAPVMPMRSGSTAGRLSNISTAR